MKASAKMLEIKKYRPARLATGKEWFVEYYVYRPDTQTMARKKIKLNHIDKISERRIYASGLIRRLNTELEAGWNPFIYEENATSYTLLIKVLDDFMKLQRKKFAEKDIRKSTILSYESYNTKLTGYIKDKNLNDMFVFAWNKEFILKYLDYIYNKLNFSSRTRDNYLKFLRLFSNYLVERDFLKVSPAGAIAVLGKSKRQAKNRTIIPPDIMVKLSAYLNKENKHYLLACHILYFCMIRPLEMTFIKIKHIDLNRSVIFIPGETAKNYKDGLVTIPEALLKLFIDLKIKEFPPEFYLFSEGFKPGLTIIKEQRFSHYWDRHVRKDLKLPMSLKFYSLKDTGITDMIREHNDPLLARDQARHHDLSITDMYTPHDIKQANEAIRKDTRKF